MSDPIQGGAPLQPPKPPEADLTPAWANLQGKMKDINQGLQGLMAPLSENQGQQLYQNLNEAGKMLDNLPAGQMKDLAKTAMEPLMGVTVPIGGKPVKLGDALNQGEQATMRWLSSANNVMQQISTAQGPVVSGSELGEPRAHTELGEPRAHTELGEPRAHTELGGIQAQLTGAMAAIEALIS